MAKKKKDKTDKNGLPVLTIKQAHWLEFYFQTKNATKAAELAGYSNKNSNINVWAVQGGKNLRNAKIKEHIRARMQDAIMSGNEALWNLSRLAVIVDVAEYISFRDRYDIDKDGKSYLVGVIADFDIERFQQDGFGHLIKAIRNTRNGPNIELKDPESSNVWIGKSDGRFIDVIKDDRERVIKVTLVKDK